MSHPAELYACLLVKEFPAQALLRLRPGLQEKPCVVMHGDPPLESVCALNTKARLLGLRTGMTRVEVETFAGPVVLRRSAQEEAATRAVLLECAGAFSPRIEDRTSATEFVCAIDIAGTHALFGPPEMLARLLRQRVRALGIAARIAVSSNLHAAVSLAKGLAGSSLRVVAHGEQAAALASLPLSVLDLTEAQAGTFAMWGIHTLGMLSALPEQELISRLGQEGKRLRQMARGEHLHLFQPMDVPCTLEERAELDFPLEDLESLLFGLSAMLEQLIVRAKARIVALASVSITLRLEDGSSHTRTVRPALPANDRQLWLKLLQLDLEAHPPHAAILAVELHAEPGATSKVQLGLFSPQLPEPGRLDVTLARIAALVGQGNLGQAVLDDTHAAQAFHLEPFQLSSQSTPAESASQVCVRQIRPPQQLSVVLQQARPASFFFRNQRCIVERAYGPWQTSGDWWEQTIWGHEQWDLVVRTQQGSLLFCCIVHDLMQDQWRLVALYD